jgi:hypothetical protein
MVILVAFAASSPPAGIFAPAQEVAPRPPVPAARGAEGEAKPSRIALTIRPRSREVRQLQPIVVEYEVKNVSKDATLIFDAMYPTPLKVRVRLRGEEVPGTAYSKSFAMMVLRGKGVSLQPGKSWKGSFVPNLVHDMTTPGTYEISAVASGQIKGDRAEAGPIEVVVVSGTSAD